MHQKTPSRRLLGPAFLLAATLGAGCANQPSNTSAAPADSGATTPAGKPASGAQATVKPGTPAAAAGKAAAGMNSQGEVVDSSKVEAGQGRKVKGLNDWEGEITGKPAPRSKFTKLQIGMTMRQAVNIAGQPSDEGAYITGKAWIPFYFGGDRHRYEMVYKGQGRLVFAGGSLGDYTGGNLIWIIHNANEPGTR
ncbi:hypothetical protein [Caldimonas brevitalea]|uniref:Uncharacterized protein n=1 Tax=Caldimonas brevitalea TaxID=413882 RepID=A0A0G3BR58_9BURK|nr:hypothetical protein [Caldimonas brevitalea]AKJ30478.1 hypothetical protein AAW51_3787 [Caldimonas brevitalea]